MKKWITTGEIEEVTIEREETDFVFVRNNRGISWVAKHDELQPNESQAISSVLVSLLCRETELLYVEDYLRKEQKRVHRELTDVVDHRVRLEERLANIGKSK